MPCDALMDNCLTFPQVMIVCLVTLMDCWFKRGACGPICAGHFASNILESKPYFLFYFFMHDPAYFGIWHYMALIFFFMYGNHFTSVYAKCLHIRRTVFDIFSEMQIVVLFVQIRRRKLQYFQIRYLWPMIFGLPICRFKVILPDTLNCKDIL